MNNREALLSLYLSLHHNRGGNFTKFSEIIRNANFEHTLINKYFAFNALNALCIQNIIDIAWTRTGIKWRVSRQNVLNDIEKILARVSSTNPNIFIGKLPFQILDDHSICTDLPIDGMCNIGEIIDSSLQEEDGLRNFEGVIQRYCFENSKWLEAKNIREESSLIRTRNRYNDVNHYLYIDPINKLYVYKHIEWLFVIAVNMLDIEPSKVLELNDRNLSINSSFRLPAVVSRNLYKHSKRTELGYLQTFERVSNDKLNETLKYAFPGIKQ